MKRTAVLERRLYGYLPERINSWGESGKISIVKWRGKIKKINQRRESRGRLTIRGDFVGRVEPAVPARRRADVHVEMDVVSQPVAALLVPHEYRLLPLLRPFTSVTERRKGGGGKKRANNTVQGRVMREEAPFITA